MKMTAERDALREQLGSAVRVRRADTYVIVDFEDKVLEVIGSRAAWTVVEGEQSND